MNKIKTLFFSLTSLSIIPLSLTSCYSVSNSNINDQNNKNTTSSKVTNLENQIAILRNKINEEQEQILKTENSLKNADTDIQNLKTTLTSSQSELSSKTALLSQNQATFKIKAKELQNNKLASEYKDIVSQVIQGNTKVVLDSIKETSFKTEVENLIKLYNDTIELANSVQTLQKQVKDLSDKIAYQSNLLQNNKLSLIKDKNSIQDKEKQIVLLQNKIRDLTRNN
ncbi:hypothetical protein [Mycoplasma hafezii]|uniref:hypothetical protein n=1 Tax=Mycoplasma hafezii TaxID=525886 RepID=UPI003CF0A837